MKISGQLEDKFLPLAKWAFSYKESKDYLSLMLMEVFKKLKLYACCVFSLLALGSGKWKKITFAYPPHQKKNQKKNHRNN